MAKKYLLYIHHPQFEVEKNKSGLVNDLLNEHYNTAAIEDTGRDLLNRIMPGSVKPRTGQETFVPKTPDPNAGYPCCQSATHRCKHWVWDTNEAIYRNTLTNKTMEAAL